MKSKIIICILIVLSSSWSLNIGNTNQSSKKAKNIILFIGDGMGLTHLYVGYIYNKGSLNLLQFSSIGIQRTYSADNYITDSGASGTALATGYKTKNQMIGLRPDSSKLTSILELAEQHKLSTGLVATSSIVHATPATFIAHNVYRYNYEEIALDFLKTDIDVFIGGGSKYFNERNDNLDLTDSLLDKGYTVLYNIKDIKESNATKLAGFTAEEHNPKISEGRGNMLTIATQKAIDILSKNENGFFLMVEGSHIDWGGHNNDAEYIAQEVIDLDKAVGVAMEFADKNAETLIIVTADHETGGLGFNNGNIQTGEIECGFTTGEHTGVWVPVYSYGPGEELFKGFYDNTDIFYKMLEVYGF